jgi:hypothetical protein
MENIRKNFLRKFLATPWISEIIFLRQFIATQGFSRKDLSRKFLATPRHIKNCMPLFKANMK